MDTANGEQGNLIYYFKDFTTKTKPRNPIQKKLKDDVLTSALSLYRGRELVYKAFQSGTFPKPEKSQECKGLKILTPNQMLKRLPIALAQIKAGNNSENLLNEIRQFILCIDQKKLLKKYTIT